MKEETFKGIGGLQDLFQDVATERKCSRSGGHRSRLQCPDDFSFPGIPT